MYYGEKDGVFRACFAAEIGAFAKNQAQRICGLMPCSSPLYSIRFFVRTGIVEAWDFEGISEVGSCETSTKKLGECATSGAIVWIGKVVMKIRLPRRREEQKPIFLNLRSGLSWIAGEFCERSV